MGSQPEQSERARSEPVMQNRHDHRQSQAGICAITSSSARCALRNQSVGRLRSRNVNCRSDGSDRRAATRGRQHRTLRSNPHDLAPLHNIPPPVHATDGATPALRISARSYHARHMPDTHKADQPDRPLTSRARLWIIPPAGRAIAGFQTRLGWKRIPGRALLWVARGCDFMA